MTLHITLIRSKIGRSDIVVVWSTSVPKLFFNLMIPKDHNLKCRVHSHEGSINALDKESKVILHNMGDFYLLLEFTKVGETLTNIQENIITKLHSKPSSPNFQNLTC